MAEPLEHSARPAIDYAIGVGGATSPAWLVWLHQASEIAAAIAAIGGAILVAIRIAIALREWQRKGRR